MISTDTVGGEITLKGMFFGDSTFTFFDSRTYPDAGVFICVDEACTIQESCSKTESEETVDGVEIVTVSSWARANSRSDTRILCRLNSSSEFGTAISSKVIQRCTTPLSLPSEILAPLFTPSRLHPLVLPRVMRC